MESDFVREFLARYRREYDYYARTARIVAERCEALLSESGIRAIVTNRAKRPDKLKAKTVDRENKRNKERGHGYLSVQEVYDDIADLAGVRIALYFPADRAEVDKLLREAFDLEEAPRLFPESAPKPTTQNSSTYEKRFSGYAATHYRVRIKASMLSESDRRYSDSRVEIQLASVLMHAWAEVEHDLAYKPESGQLSTEEHAILDELNGLVLAGEIALERLQSAMERRVAGDSFRSHYELAAYLYEQFRAFPGRAEIEPTMGRVDTLFKLLDRANLARPDGIHQFIAAVHENTEARPLAEQIVDLVLLAQPARYDDLRAIRTEDDIGHAAETSSHTSEEANRKLALADFIHAWVRFEQAIVDAAPQESRAANAMVDTPTRLMRRLKVPHEIMSVVHQVRHLRNQAVHSTDPVEPERLRDAIAFLEELITGLKSGNIEWDIVPRQPRIQ